MASWRAMVRTRRSKPLNSRSNTAWAASNAPRPRLPRLDVRPPAPYDPCRKPPRRGRPTFSPKPRKVPRRLASISRSFDCTSLRAVSSARVSCAVFDACNAPAETNQAAASTRYRAHRCGRDFTGIALNASRARAASPKARPQGRMPASPHTTIAKAARPQADPHQAQTCRPEPRNQRLRLARHLPLPHDLPVRIHNANTRAFQ